MLGRVYLLILVVLASLLVYAILYTLSPNSDSEVNILYAGSLINLMEKSLGPRFRELGYGYRGEGHGSLQNVNMILDGQRYPDVFISAGIDPMERLMETNPPIVSWYIIFAADEIVIAYNEDSKFAEQLEGAASGYVEWYRVISIPSLRFLRTDPELDPKGYYTVIVAKLADLYYGESWISRSMLRGTRNPEQIRPEETLMTLLETGEADAVASYRHEAVERGLPYIILPPQINLGYPEYADFYARASYTFMDGRTIRGKPITFAATIPKTVKNLEGAVSFMLFLLSEESKGILDEHGFRVLRPKAVGDLCSIPTAIRRLVNVTCAPN